MKVIEATNAATGARNVGVMASHGRDTIEANVRSADDSRIVTYASVSRATRARTERVVEVREATWDSAPCMTAARRETRTRSTQ